MRWALAGLVGALAAGACVKSVTGTVDLSVQQTDSLFVEIDQATAAAKAAAGASGLNYSFQSACPQGGTIKVSVTTLPDTSSTDTATSFASCGLANYGVGGSLDTKVVTDGATTVQTTTGQLAVTTTGLGASGLCPVNFVDTLSKPNTTAHGIICGLDAAKGDIR